MNPVCFCVWMTSAGGFVASVVIKWKGLEGNTLRCEGAPLNLCPVFAL